MICVVSNQRLFLSVWCESYRLFWVFDATRQSFHAKDAQWEFLLPLIL